MERTYHKLIFVLARQREGKTQVPKAGAIQGQCSNGSLLFLLGLGK